MLILVRQVSPWIVASHRFPGVDLSYWPRCFGDRVLLDCKASDPTEWSTQNAQNHRDLGPERVAGRLLSSQRIRPNRNGREPIEDPSQFYNSPGTGPVGERFLPDHTVQQLEKVIVTRNQFYISTGTGPVGERFLPDHTVQELEKVIATRNQFYISPGTGPVGERFLAADGVDL